MSKRQYKVSCKRSLKGLNLEFFFQTMSHKDVEDPNLTGY